MSFRVKILSRWRGMAQLFRQNNKVISKWNCIFSGFLTKKRKNWRQFVAVRLCRKLHIILLSREKAKSFFLRKMAKKLEIIWSIKCIKISFPRLRYVIINSMFRQLSIYFVCFIKNFRRLRKKTWFSSSWTSFADRLQ